MTGDPPDILSRLKGVLPTRWFPDTTPVLDAVLSGFAVTWSSLYDLLAAVRQQSRVATATGSFLDMTSRDFFSTRLSRRPAEADTLFRARILQALRREHATRAALSTVLQDLTGRAPVVFEPSRPADTGAYATGSLGYGAAGAWGSLDLPFQVFITARRSQHSGIAEIAGYGTPGPLVRATLAEIGGQATDADIYAAIASVMPTAATAWTCITN